MRLEELKLQKPLRTELDLPLDYDSPEVLTAGCHEHLRVLAIVYKHLLVCVPGVSVVVFYSVARWAVSAATACPAPLYSPCCSEGNCDVTNGIFRPLDVNFEAAGRSIRSHKAGPLHDLDIIQWREVV